MHKLQEAKKIGQQIWLDNLSRSLIVSGKLADILAQGIGGVTSNPAIFQKAFATDSLYQEEIQQLKQRKLNPKQCYETLAVHDVQAACDVCLPWYNQDSQMGLVSLEVSPELAHDAQGTVSEALQLFHQVNRPNVMIKIPATDAGVVAMTQLVAQGVNVNLTLLFSRQQTMSVYSAYLQGLQQRLSQGLPIIGIQVVASFFLSRIDTALDVMLPENLKGQTAIALAKTAYHDWQQYFLTDKFHSFQTAGASPARLLWASTATKNPNYSETQYVSSVIGNHTINTVPEKTLSAWLSNSEVVSNTLCQNVDSAFAILAALAELGIDLEGLAHRLQQDGIQQFLDAFEQILKLF